MPAVSRSQQRLFAIAEHEPGKLYAKNKGLAKLPHKTLHDFASGSEKGKPEHVKRALHPALRARADAVKAAHAHLSATMPGFRNLPGHQQLRHTQRHVTRTMKRGY